MPSKNPQQAKWNQRYQNTQTPNAPARVLIDNRHLLPQQGDALELACGLGGNALELARAGLRTQAWDISDVAIAKLQHLARQQQLPLQACCIDLKPQSLAVASFDLICVTGYLDRALCPAISAALRPGGLLFYQTFSGAKHGTSGPSNPDFVLQQGELLRLFCRLTPLVYREPLHDQDPDSNRPEQAYLVARR
ncbi:MAG: class I SAM-dependent methyltransferase [Motiliproteus sp.]